MAIDTPARLAILGAGPVGVEAALYARFLGYDVLLLERGRVGETLLRWGHVQLFTPWKSITSPLGLSALAAQDDAWAAPDPEACPTAREYVERYLQPLAESDLIVDSLHHGEVFAISRPGALKDELREGDLRRELPLRVYWSETEGESRGRIHRDDVDAVIDATGRSRRAPIGDGGVWAVGEQEAEKYICFVAPDALGEARSVYAGQRTLVVGAGHSAAVTVVALAQLAAEAPGTHVLWLTRHGGTPVDRFSNDPFPARDAMSQAANAAVTRGAVKHLYESVVEAVEWLGEGQGFQVTLGGHHAGPQRVDRIVACAGWRPDERLWSEFLIDLSATTGGIHGLADVLPEADAPMDRLPTLAPKMLIQPEPDFYILGAKSFGRDGRFLIPFGLEQIRTLFTILGDRPSLDLYR